MARKLITVRGDSYVGEFPHDVSIGWVNGRRGIRRTLCKITDIDHLSDGQKIQRLNDLYHLKQHELRHAQVIQEDQAKKAKQARKKITVADAKKLWLSDLKITNTDKTAEMYARSIDYYVSACGNHELAAISRSHNTKFLAFLSGPISKGNKSIKLSAETQKKHVRHLKTFLAWAYDHEIIDRMIRLKSPKSPKKDMETFTIPELDKLGSFLKEKIKNAEKESDKEKYINLYRAYMLATNTLLRVGAIWSLKLENIDLEKRILRIRDVAELKFKNKGLKWPNKPINDELYDFLKTDLEQRDKREKFFLDKGDGNLWRSDRGDISRQMSIVCNECGLPKIKPFHWGMRATLITELLNKGVDPHVVQMLADHSSLSTTLMYRNTRTINQVIAANHISELKNVTNMSQQKE